MRRSRAGRTGATPNRFRNQTDEYDDYFQYSSLPSMEYRSSRHYKQIPPFGFPAAGISYDYGRTYREQLPHASTRSDFCTQEIPYLSQPQNEHRNPFEADLKDRSGSSFQTVSEDRYGSRDHANMGQRYKSNKENKRGKAKMSYRGRVENIKHDSGSEKKGSIKNFDRKSERGSIKSGLSFDSGSLKSQTLRRGCGRYRKTSNRGGLDRSDTNSRISDAGSSHSGGVSLGFQVLDKDEMIKHWVHTGDCCQPDICDVDVKEMFDIILQKFKGQAKISDLTKEIRSYFESDSHSRVLEWFKTSKQAKDWFRVFENECLDGASVITCFRKPLKVCFRYMGSGVCHGKCSFLHICIDNLANKCTRKRCKYNHNIFDEHNKPLLSKLGLLEYSVAEVYNLLRTSSLKTCNKYNCEKVCDEMEFGSCPNLHICQDYIRKKCENSKCMLEHDVLADECKKTLQIYELDHLYDKENVLKKHILVLSAGRAKRSRHKLQPNKSDSEKCLLFSDSDLKPQKVCRKQDSVSESTVSDDAIVGSYSDTQITCSEDGLSQKSSHENFDDIDESIDESHNAEDPDAISKRFWKNPLPQSSESLHQFKVDNDSKMLIHLTQYIPSASELNFLSEMKPAQLSSFTIDEVQFFIQLLSKCNGISNLTYLIENVKGFSELDVVEWYKQSKLANELFLLFPNNVADHTFITVFVKQLKVCYAYSQICRKQKCPCLHLCKEFISGNCRNLTGTCRYSHDVRDLHNDEIFKTHLLKLGLYDQLSEQHLLDLVNCSRLKICVEHITSDDGTCENSRSCPYFHICDRFLKGRCMISDDKCQYRHHIKSKENIKILQKYDMDMLNSDIIKSIIFLPHISSRTWLLLNPGSSIPQANIHDTESLIPICESDLRGVCQMRNECKEHHYIRPYLWQIKRHGKWIGLDVNDSFVKIEEKFCDVEIDSHIVENADLERVPSTITINFKDMTWNSMDVEYGEIRRLSTKSYVENDPDFTRVEHLCTRWLWYWQDEYGIWNPYEYEKAPYQDVLEAKYIHGDQCTFYEIGKNKYILDFKTMIQTNIIYKTRRRVKRRPIFTNGKIMKDFSIEKDPANARHYQPKKLPSGWSPMDGANPGICDKILLKPNDEEYTSTKMAFFETMDETRFEITEIYRIQNLTLWEAFLSQKAKMEQCNGHFQKKLFHGTDSKETVDCILHQSFDPRMHGKNATVYGKGAYFATNANYSNSYTGSMKQKTMFYARVLIGKTTVGNGTMQRPPPLNPSRPHGDLYDTCVNNQNNPTIFVVFKSEQCYPEYIIHFTDKIVDDIHLNLVKPNIKPQISSNISSPYPFNTSSSSYSLSSSHAASSSSRTTSTNRPAFNPSTTSSSSSISSISSTTVSFTTSTATMSSSGYSTSRSSFNPATTISASTSSSSRYSASTSAFDPFSTIASTTFSSRHSTYSSAFHPFPATTTTSSSRYSTSTSSQNTRDPMGSRPSSSHASSDSRSKKNCIIS